MGAFVWSWYLSDIFGEGVIATFVYLCSQLNEWPLLTTEFKQLNTDLYHIHTNMLHVNTFKSG